MAHAGGRPTLYTPELAQKICEAIVLNPMSLKKICAANKDLPSYDAIYNWINKYSEFNDQYLIAKEQQADWAADALWDRVLDVDERPEAISKVMLELKFTQWQNARLAPKKWKEKTETKSEVTVAVHEDRLKDLK